MTTGIDMAGDRSDGNSASDGLAARARNRSTERPPYSEPPFDYSSVYDRNLPAADRPRREARIRSWMDPVAQQLVHRSGRQRGRGA